MTCLPVSLAVSVSNGYSLYCAELMVNMKDVPSTERMVLCSKQWKMMTQKEKDMFQKRCEQVRSWGNTDQMMELLLEMFHFMSGCITGTLVFKKMINTLFV